MAQWITGSIALALVAACDADHTAARRTDGSAGTPPVNHVAVAHPAASPASTAPTAAHVGCDTIAQLFQRAAVAAGNSASAVTAPRDTIGGIRGKAEPACLVTWRDSTADGMPLHDLYARLEHSGWQRRERLVAADGPGAEAIAFSRNGAACVVGGEADVEDDADSTHVPAPGFIISATCYSDRPDPT